MVTQAIEFTDPVEKLVNFLQTAIDTCQDAIKRLKIQVHVIQDNTVGELYADCSGDSATQLVLIEEARVNIKAKNERLKTAEWRLKQMVELHYVPCQYHGCIVHIEEERVVNLATDNYCARHAREVYARKPLRRRIA